MSQPDGRKTVYQGRHLLMVEQDRWEFATRNKITRVVAIVPVTDDGRVVLVEQFRPPVGRTVMELPAGLVGDQEDHSEETILEAAQRELLEETGYTAQHWTKLGQGYSTPGLTDESIELYLAEGLAKQHLGGGDESEQITIHKIPFEEFCRWLTQKNAMADLKSLAGLLLAERHRSNRS